MWGRMVSRTILSPVPPRPCDLRVLVTLRVCFLHLQTTLRHCPYLPVALVHWIRGLSGSQNVFLTVYKIFCNKNLYFKGSLLESQSTYKWLGVRVLAPLWLVTFFALSSNVSEKSSRALEMMTGTGAATLPTSSSLCIIFLIRAWKCSFQLVWVLNVILWNVICTYSAVSLFNLMPPSLTWLNSV